MTQVTRDQVADLSFEEPYLPPSSAQKFLHSSSPGISPLRNTPYSGKVLGSPTFLQENQVVIWNKTEPGGFPGKDAEVIVIKQNQQGQGTVASLKYFFLCFFVVVVGSQAIDRGRVH